MVVFGSYDTHSTITLNSMIDSWFNCPVCSKISVVIFSENQINLNIPHLQLLNMSIFTSGSKQNVAMKKSYLCF